MPDKRMSDESDAGSWIRRKAGIFLSVRPTPRITLFFIAASIKYIASSFSYAGYFLKNPVLLVSGIIVWLIWFAVLLLIAIPATDQFLRKQMRRLKPAAMTIFIILLLAGIIEIIGLSVINTGVFQDRHPKGRISELIATIDDAFVYNDSTALTQQATENFLDGKNPYAEANIISAMEGANGSYNKVTPLREGRFGEIFPYPETEEIERLWQEAVNNPASVPAEFETRLNYPAGSFLLAAPFFLLGVDNLRVVNLIYALPILAYVVIRAPRNLRVFLIAFLLVSLEIWNLLASGGAGFLAFLFLLLAWLLPRKHLWLSALCMGVAIATKQIAWFFLPFYIIFIFKNMDTKKMLSVLAIVAAVFLAVNAQFIISDPKLWMSSVLAPMTGNLFPWGIGIVSLVSGGVFEIQSPLVFSVLQIIVCVSALVWYFNNCLRYPNSGLLLAVLPLFFAWRSLWAYFFYIDIIILASVIINEYRFKAPAQPAAALVSPDDRQEIS
ncbi:hypothetical protein ACFLYB_03910 [Chloroflexota bacterium]